MAEVKVVEGYSNGFGFDEFKKGETVYVFYSSAPAKELELTEGKIISVVRAKNAEGRDVIRQISIDLDSTHYQVSGFRGIREKIYRKDKVVEAAPVVPEKKEKKAKPISGQSVEYVDLKPGYQSIWVEKAMTPKNKLVKLYLNEGWQWVDKVWDGERNMYRALLERVCE